MLSDERNSQKGQSFTAGVLSPALDSALDTDPVTAPLAAAEPGFLLFRCAGVDCAVPLFALREVLPRCPAALPLPHGPEWLLGVFALRAELVGLVDPAPLLFGAASDPREGGAHGAALLAGTGARALAWAVESIGATAPLAQDVSDATDGEQPEGDTPDAPLLTIAAPYAAGMIAPAPGQRYAVIDVGALLADMLRALEERPAEA